MKYLQQCRSQKYSPSHLGIMTQILLEAHQQHRDIWTEVFDLLDPALRDVLQAVRARDGEAEQEHVSVGV